MKLIILKLFAVSYFAMSTPASGSTARTFYPAAEEETSDYPGSEVYLDLVSI